MFRNWSLVHKVHTVLLEFRGSWIMYCSCILIQLYRVLIDRFVSPGDWVYLVPQGFPEVPAGLPEGLDILGRIFQNKNISCLALIDSFYILLLSIDCICRKFVESKYSNVRLLFFKFSKLWVQMMTQYKLLLIWDYLFLAVALLKVIPLWIQLLARNLLKGHNNNFLEKGQTEVLKGYMLDIVVTEFQYKDLPFWHT